MALSQLATPSTRSPSRSERLLRDTLRRDELAAPVRNRAHRRHSSPSTKPIADHDGDVGHSGAGFVSPVLHRSTTTPRRPPRPQTASSAHNRSDARDRYSRPCSPSPSSRRESHDHGHPSLLTLTPHEQVLRARLERVLQAGRGIARAEIRHKDRDLLKRRTSARSGTASTSSSGSGPSDDCDDLSFFRENSLSASPTFTFQTSLHQHDSGRLCPGSSTDPTLFSPPSPTSSRGRSRRGSQSHKHSPPHLFHEAQSSQLHAVPTEHPQQPLTPPPTPPLAPSVLTHTPTRDRLVSSRAYPTGSPHTPFNVRTASAQCRQIDGYVSFASVEGLGQPPPECDDECDDEKPGTVAEEGKSLVFLGRIWRALGGEAVGSR